MEGGYSLLKLPASASDGDFTGENEQEVPKFIAMMTHHVHAVLQRTAQKPVVTAWKMDSCVS